jgi:murein DD-endopeptidase MepM/ murein hydrolase activator NlpD
MFSRIKFFLYCGIVLGAGYMGWNGYHYFFNVTSPQVSLMGIEPNGYYAGDVSCVALGSDAYKVAWLSVWLDDKTLIDKSSVRARSFEHPFSFSTREIAPGKHTIKLEVVNGTYAAHKTILEKSFFVDNEPLQAAFSKSESNLKVLQGRTLHVKFQVNKKIKEANVSVLNVTYPCFPESQHISVYECFIPISCEQEPAIHDLYAQVTDLVGNSLKLAGSFEVVQAEFKRQNLNVTQEKVAQERELGLHDDLLEVELQKLVQQSPQEKLWHGVFYCPTEIQRISTEFGAIRTTREKGRYQHQAIDILNAPKSVVWAPQDGVVIIKNRYALSGNTIVIDHGYGIISLFFHLENFADSIEVGTKVKRGNPIGSLGMTGYATGYHLHWEMRVANIKVDPMQWTKQTF